MKMQVEIVGERKKETASIILVGILLGICFAAIMGSVTVLVSVYFEIEINLQSTIIFSLIVGILLGEAVEVIIFGLLNRKMLSYFFKREKDKKWEVK